MQVLLFNEVVVEDEYQPAVPNDYYEIRKKMDIVEAKERVRYIYRLTTDYGSYPVPKVLRS